MDITWALAVFFRSEGCTVQIIMSLTRYYQGLIGNLDFFKGGLDSYRKFNSVSRAQSIQNAPSRSGSDRHIAMSLVDVQEQCLLRTIDSPFMSHVVLNIAQSFSSLL